MILLIDNYDSFSYNLYQLIGSFDDDIRVIRNDEMTVEQIEALNPTHIVLSPGPGKPENAGVCVELVKKLKNKYKILGVCLGHQAICEAFGAKVTYAKTLMHGKTSVINVTYDNSVLFKEMKKEIKVARYHSLAADKESIPEQLIVSALTDDGEVMAVEYRFGKVYGVQFHPESILTPQGKTVIKNFLEA